LRSCLSPDRLLPCAAWDRDQFALVPVPKPLRVLPVAERGLFLSSAALPKHDHREEQHRDAGHDDDDDLPLHFSALRQFGQLRVMHAAAGRRELAAPMFGDRARWRVWEPRWRRRGFLFWCYRIPDLPGKQRRAYPPPTRSIDAAAGRGSFPFSPSSSQFRLAVQRTTSDRSSGILNGLEIYASHPLARIFFLSPDMANAVIAMIGIVRVCSSPLSR
jgi:hypothetical protein